MHLLSCDSSMYHHSNFIVLKWRPVLWNTVCFYLNFLFSLASLNSWHRKELKRLFWKIVQLSFKTTIYSCIDIARYAITEPIDLCRLHNSFTSMSKKAGYRPVNCRPLCLILASTCQKLSPQSSCTFA